MSLHNFIGALVNGAGTLIATAKGFGSSTLNTTDPTKDASTIVKIGGCEMTIKNAISTGYLNRNAAGVLEELNPAQPYTRQG